MSISKKIKNKTLNYKSFNVLNMLVLLFGPYDKLKKLYNLRRIEKCLKDSIRGID